MKEEKRSLLCFIGSAGAQISVCELRKFGSGAHCPSTIAVQVVLVAAFCPLACGCDGQFAGSCSAVPAATHTLACHCPSPFLSLAVLVLFLQKLVEITG